jgi:hypothetical protein
VNYLIEGKPTLFEDYPNKTAILVNVVDGLTMIPEGMRETVFYYVAYGLPGGHFLNAVVSNNLKEAVARADTLNTKALPEYVRYFYNHAPAECWGSEENAANWLKKGKENLNGY